MRRLPIPALLAAAALAASGCGGGGGSSAPEGVPPTQWAESVCGALTDWQTSLQQKSQGLTSDVLQAKSPEAAKQQIATFLDDVIAETDGMIADVGGAGQPAVDQGDQIASDFQDGLQQMRAAFETAQKRVADVPTSDPQAFQQALTRIGQELQTQGQAIGGTIGKIDQKYDAPDLSKAFDENPACKDFSGSGSG